MRVLTSSLSTMTVGCEGGWALSSEGELVQNPRKSVNSFVCLVSKVAYALNMWKYEIDVQLDYFRGVIGDIIHYFTLMSSKLTLFALFFIFRHYSLFFQKYENNVINSLQFSKTFDYFRKILCEIQLFLQERFAHKALGLLLTAQRAFDRERDGLTRLL